MIPGFFGQPLNLYRKNLAGVKLAYAPPGAFSAYSIFDADSLAGNIGWLEPVWSPTPNEAFIGSDGIPYMVLPAVGRQEADYAEYSYPLHNYVPVVAAVDGITATYVINNSTPAGVGTIPAQQAYTFIQYEGVILEDYSTDLDGDPLTWTLQSGTLVSGVMIQTVVLNVGQPNQRTVTRPRGLPAPGTEGVYSITLRGTDYYGSFVDLSYTFTVGTGVLVPTLDTGFVTLSDGTSIIFSQMPLSSISVIYQPSTVVAPGSIISQTPSKGQYVPQGTPVGLTVSSTTIGFYIGAELGSGGGGTGIDYQVTRAARTMGDSPNKHATRIANLVEMETMYEKLSGESASPMMQREVDAVIAPYTTGDEIDMAALMENPEARDALKALFKRYDSKRREMFKKLRNDDYDYDPEG